MTENVCAVLTAVFPLVLLSVLTERRAMHPNIGRAKVTRNVTAGCAVAALLGTSSAIWGVQIHGYDGVSAAVMWTYTVVVLFGLAYILLAGLATIEAKEDRKK